MNTSQIVVPLLATLAVGGLYFAVVDPLLSGSRKAEKRQAALRSRTPAAVTSRANDVAKRRKQVSESLKELEARAKSKKLTFETKMAQAGVGWTKRNYYIVSGLVGTLALLAGLFVLHNPLLGIGLAITFGVGVPAWLLNHLRKRRIKKFLAEFPSAVDMIVRGIKAGIPLGDCLRNIANEAAEPVRTEFRVMVEAQALGLTVAEAVERIIDRVPAPEANFFSIVISIQAKAGGNLAEALANLSNVLRDRKKMRGKIKAMSSEAKASAGIIGALPPLVALFVYLTSPGYISLLFVTSTGHYVLGGCVLWMSTGIFIMKKMINFDM